MGSQKDSIEPTNYVIHYNHAQHGWRLILKDPSTDKPIRTERRAEKILENVAGWKDGDIIDYDIVED